MTNDSNMKRGNAQKAMTGTDWREVLVKHPERAAECDWSKLSGNDWWLLLRAQPQFAERCDWSKLSEDELNVLQKHQPELVAASWRSASKPRQITERH